MTFWHPLEAAFLLKESESKLDGPFRLRYLEGELRLGSGDLALISVKGDSMEPTLRSGDRVLIDRADTNISQPGIFVLWDGDGRMI